MLMDTFRSIHHVGFNALKITPLRLTPFSVFLKTYLSKWNALYSECFCLFNCCDGRSNIKTVKTKENGKYISYEMHDVVLPGIIDL